MPSKEFTFGFVLSAAMNSSFAASFSKASKEVDELRQYVDKLGEETKQLQKAFGNGIINKKTFDAAILQRSEKNMLAFGKASMDLFRSSFADWSILYYKAQNFASAFAAPMQAAIQFESTMADVRKVVDFDTPQQFQQMSRDILELSKNIPMTADGLGQIVAAGGQSGIARDELVSFAEEAAKMGVAFDITADQAGNMMAQWRTAFKMGQSDVVALADKINYLGNTTAASAPMISDVTTRVGPLGEVGGVASGEIAALGASLVGAGINSDVAATGIKNLILAMASGESATKTQQEAFASLGIDTAELAQRMQTDAKGAILDVLQSISRLDKASQASTLQNIFGKESLGAIAPLLSNLDGLRANFDKVADASQYTGSMEQEFATRSQTTANSLQLMNNRMDAAKIAIGQGLIPVITPLIETFGQVASSVGNFAMENQNIIKWIGRVSGILIGLSFSLRGIRILQEEYNGVMMLYNSFSKTAALRTYAMAAASKAAALATRAWGVAQMLLSKAFWVSPMGKFAALAMAIGAAAVYVYNNWDKVRQLFGPLWDTISSAAESFYTTVQEVFTSAGDLIQRVFDNIPYYAGYAVGAVLRFFWKLPGNLLDIIMNLGSVGDTFVETAGSWGSQAVDAILNWFATLPQRLPEYLSAAWSWIQNAGSEFVRGAGEGIASNASGGIYGKGAFLTTFAEDGPEAAIPLDGSRRAVGLWTEAGQALGTLPGADALRRGLPAPRSASSGGNVTVDFRPQVTIQGNADAAVVQQAMTVTVQQLRRMLEDIAHNGRRLSYE